MKLFIFGSTGDLVRHKVIAGLQKANIKNLKIIAFGRKNMTREEYINSVCKECPEDFKQLIEYKVTELKKTCLCENCLPLLSKNEINFFYAALPPNLLKYLVSYLYVFKKKGYKIKLLMEKPFGEDLKDSIKLLEVIKKSKMEDDIFISDHYLFKKAILDIKCKDFKRIRIVSVEKVDLKGRTGYYDRVGALGDMVQNHFFNVVFKIIKNPSLEFKDFDIINCKRGQYGDGKSSGYVIHSGKKSNTETFIHLILKTKERVYEFITGKAFDEKISFIDIDEKKIDINISENPYSHIFSDFLKLKRENFPTPENSILAWRIMEKINSKKGNLEYYPENSCSKTKIHLS
jgi:glucose-6-phosphate 1-dehydrogenase